MRMRIVVLALTGAACGGGADGAAVEGTFAPGLAPTGVWVVESQRSEPADSAGFRIADLTPGPVSIRLLSGSDTAAVLNLSGLPDGARVRLRDLRVDGDSRFAFPRTVELDGADMVTVNGLRMAPSGRIPREVDVRGAMLAWSSDVGAMLVRPADPRLPDLRVVAGLATEFVGTDGGRADPTTLQPGDSLRVEGRSEEGYVLATRITVPTRIAGVGTDAGLADAPDPGREDDGDGGEGGGDGGNDSGGGGDDGGGGSVARTGPVAPAPVPVARAPAPRGSDRPGRGNGRGRGEERGKGRGNAKGKG
jgi:hypothetical protein